MRISDWSSDVCSSDLILLKQAPSPKDKVLLETLVAALWDLGLDLGHSVRTIEDCQIEAANDITVETALMEARWLAGSKDLLRTLAGTMRAQMDAQTFFQAKRTELQQRHARHQDTPYRSEEPTSELQSLMRTSHAVFC